MKLSMGNHLGIYLQLILLGIDLSAASKIASEIIIVLVSGSVFLILFAKSCSLNSCLYLPKSAFL